MKRIRNILYIMFTILFISGCSELDKFKELFNLEEKCTHTYIVSNSIEPTCTSVGYTYYRCSKCNDWYKEEVPATGHAHSSLDESTIKIPTSTTNGYSGDYKCDKCGVVTQEGHITYYNSSCTNHDYIESITKEASCEVDGIKTYTCKNCGYSYTESIASTGHEHSTLDNSTVIEATVLKEGYSGDYKCDKCGKVTTKGSVIPKLSNCLSHTYTKTLSNNKVTYTCSKCNYSYTIDRYCNVNVYGLNDFHGAIYNLEAMGTYLYNVNKKDNTLIIDSGDTWQGSLESNYNYGNLINDVECYIKVDARTVGNHDFDWGVEKLAANTSRSYNNYKIPVLAANVYDYDFDTKTTGSTQQSNVGQEYVTYTLENGLKVGIIGVIGEDQITSITTDFVKDITFTNHIDKIKELSDKLRVDENCDVIIASCHGGKDDTLSQGLNDISSVSKKQYVDLVLNAHTHYKEYEDEDGLLHIQAGCNGYYCSNVVLKYDTYEGSLSSYTSSHITNSTMSNSYSTNSTISNLISSYATDTNTIGSKVLTTKASGSWSKTNQLPNLMCEAIYKEAVKEGYNVDYAYINDARAALSGSTWTYSDIFSAFPFENKVFILKVSGNDILRELYKYNYIYRGDTSNALAEVSKNKTYTIAVLDYLAYHCNSYRNYDYFTDIKDELGYLKKNNEIYSYRDILADYIISNNSSTLSSSSYTSSTNDLTAYRFNRSLLKTSYSSIPTA